MFCSSKQRRYLSGYLRIKHGSLQTTINFLRSLWSYRILLLEFIDNPCPLSIRFTVSPLPKSCGVAARELVYLCNGLERQIQYPSLYPDVNIPFVQLLF